MGQANSSGQITRPTSGANSFPNALSHRTAVASRQAIASSRGTHNSNAGSSSDDGVSYIAVPPPPTNLSSATRPFPVRLGKFVTRPTSSANSFPNALSHRTAVASRQAIASPRGTHNSNAGSSSDDGVSYNAVPPPPTNLSSATRPFPVRLVTRPTSSGNSFPNALSHRTAVASRQAIASSRGTHNSNAENEETNHEGRMQRPHQGRGSRSRSWSRGAHQNDSSEPFSGAQWQKRGDTRRGRGRGRGRGEGGGGAPQQCRYFGFKMLEELLTKDAEEAAMKLTQNREALVNYMSQHDLQASPDIIVLVIEVTAKTLSTAFTEVVAQLLLTLTKISFFTQVESFIMQLPLADTRNKNRGRRFWNAPDAFFAHLAHVLNVMLETVPATAMDVVPHLIKAIQYTMPNIETAHQLQFDENVRKVYEDLSQKIDLIITKKEQKNKKKKKQDGEQEEENDDEAHLVPPDDFHEIDIYPTAEEITKPSTAFLRKNVVRGAYRDVQHYLDIHFRLLREDFIAPLRAGIIEYIADPRSKRISNVKIHRNVVYLGVVPNQRQVGYLVQVFKPNTIRNVEHSRRFMFGSLVCVTNNNFRSVIFGKIIDRDEKLLRQGQIVLGFDVGVKLFENEVYLLVECTIYFEPYYQVLNALKHIDDERFPMKEYLVDVETAPVRPEYLRNLTTEDLQEYLQNLNASQTEAFHGVLNKKFCIIQGPPGTGKTYLGLQVANFLLQHKEDDQCPMLVICYTNHALDQFLEGLLPTTNRLIRVGGQSRNEAMTKYNLKNLKVNIPRDCLGAQRASLARLHGVKSEIDAFGAMLKIVNGFTHVIDFSKVIGPNGMVMEVPEFRNSWFTSASAEEVLQWLLRRPEGTSAEYYDFLQASQQLRELEQEDKVPEPIDAKHEDVLDTPNRNPHEFDDDEEEDAMEMKVNYLPRDELYLFSCHETYAKICKLTAERNELLMNAGGDMSKEFWNVTQRLLKVRMDYKYVCERLTQVRSMGDAVPAYHIDYHDPHTMPADHRWLAYAHWLHQLRISLTAHYVRLDTEYRDMYKEVEEIRDMTDVHKLRWAHVVGMTTTGAARLQRTLQTLAPRIVIVEEAAEVLEAHIVTALSKHCQHLILIGDHKQLKPSTADYDITNEYRLGVSLFERMVGNGVHCHTLNVQHRMRPEIANLVCPSIYPELVNHESVDGYPMVQGVDSPLFFITHTEREVESNDKSKENLFEAQYLVHLARYLVLNNYSPEKITIIATYSGQWFLMRKIKANFEALKGVRICILDNYQGEENDIILLSLVRNNEEKRNGFLELENRICVALSRAKIGLYIMGNIDQLCHRSKIWRQVHEVLQKYNAIGPALSLRCVNHTESVTQIATIDDFDKVPEGGCLLPCAQTLDCGHICMKLCHSTTHDNYKCHQACTRVLCEFQHVCPLKCYEECQKCVVPKNSVLPCGHTLDIPCHMTPEEYECGVLVETTLPCEHVTDKPCHADADTFRCPYPCKIRIEPCGHACLRTCHIRNDPHHEKYRCRKTCAKSNKGCSMPDELMHKCLKFCSDPCDPCASEVKKERDCGHFYDLPCHQDVNEIVCKKRCKRTMPCGHGCKNPCRDVCGPCKVKVNKTISACGHTLEWECGSEPTKRNCKAKKCTELLECGHPCPLACGADCERAKCTTLVRYTMKASPCGHELMVPCHLHTSPTITNEILSYCTQKCEVKLQCGHTCVGTCGTCAQGRIHQRCGEPCSKILICGHACTTPCMTACQPCTKECDFLCEHSKCSKKCGAPCTGCKEVCGRRCKHQVCKALCGAICTVPPCDKPCPLVLGCGHPCIGYCGDTCPPFCRICHKSQVTEIFFGNEEDEEARFVYLPQCKHLVEGTALQQWFGVDADAREIVMPTCPKCKTPVHVRRYKHLILDAYNDIQKIKTSYFGHPKEIKEMVSKIVDRISTMRRIYPEFSTKGAVYFRTAMRMTHKHKRQDHSKARLTCLDIQLDVYEEMLKIRREAPSLVTPENCNMVNNQFHFLDHHILTDAFVANQQQIDDVRMEVMRFQRIVQLCVVRLRNPSRIQTPPYTDLMQILFNFSKYDMQMDANAKELLRKMNTMIALTEVERKQIVAAIGLSPGHWFKCANGHIYAIGECGGAMQVGKCPECGLQIGGTQHTLLRDNQFAPEMGNATQPAYPTLNNIDLYDLN